MAAATPEPQVAELDDEETAMPIVRRRISTVGDRAPRDFRSLLLQALALLAVLGFVTFIGINVVTNVNRLGVETGFAFLSAPAGFDISQKLIPYSARSTYFDAFLVALFNTMLLTIVCIVISTAIGLLVGLGRLSRNPLLASVSAGCVEVIRNIPLLLQLLFWYFVVVRPLPAPRNGISFFDLAFLSNRGLYLPAPDSGFAALFLVVAVGIAASIVLMRLTTQRKMDTGRASGLRCWCRFRSFCCRRRQHSPAWSIFRGASPNCAGSTMSAA